MGPGRLTVLAALVGGVDAHVRLRQVEDEPSAAHVGMGGKAGPVAQERAPTPPAPKRRTSCAHP